MPSNESRSNERLVTIQRQPGGGLGISVKGGAEHGIPVLISRVFPGQAADQAHHLHPGDAILAINGKKVEHMLHDDVVNELRSCGSSVTLTVCPFDGANRLLSTKKKSSSTFPKTESIESGQFVEAITSVKNDSFSASVDYEAMDTSTRIDSSSLADSSQKDLAIPLLFARLQWSPDKNHSFEVVSNNQFSTGILSCTNNQEQLDWINAVSEAIIKASDCHLKELQQQLSCDKIIQMGWINEQVKNSMLWNYFFVVLTENELRFFKFPPKTEVDWKNCNRIYSIYELLCRFQPNDLAQDHPYCFRFQHEVEQPIYCSVSTQEDLERWKQRIQKVTFEAVYKLKVKSYPCSREGTSCHFIIHFNDGFKLIQSASEDVLWSYKFSQLKSSSDDHNSTITFTFHNRANNQIDKQSFSCDHAYSLLFCVHSFLAAKLALIDPAFLEKINAQSQFRTDLQTSGDSLMQN